MPVPTTLKVFRQHRSLSPYQPQPAMKATFFDLPLDALSHIAKVMLDESDSNDECLIHENLPNYANIIPFCENNALHCQAVLQALQYKLTLSQCQDQTTEGILSIFRDLIRELDMRYYFGERVPENFPARPQIRKASIHGTDAHLTAMKGIPTLTDLTVILSDNDWEKGINVFIDTLNSLSLSILTIEITAWDPRYILKEPRCQMQVARACPTVKELRWKSSRQMVTEYWTLFTELKSLEVLSIEGQEDKRLITTWRIPFFKTLKKLYLNIGIPIRWGIEIGKPVRCITQTRSACGENVSKLSKLPHLTEIHLSLLYGAERALLTMPLQSLELLDLTWGIQETHWWVDPDKNLARWYQDGEGRDELGFYEPNKDVMLNIVKKATSLQTLHLNQCRIKVHTVVKMLQGIGSRLQNLHLSMDEKYEYIAPQIEIVLDAIARYCHNISRIIFNITGVILTTEERQISCMDALRRVQKLCPKFVSGPDVKRLIEYFTIGDMQLAQQ